MKFQMKHLLLLHCCCFCSSPAVACNLLRCVYFIRHFEEFSEFFRKYILPVQKRNKCVCAFKEGKQPPSRLFAWIKFFRRDHFSRLRRLKSSVTRTNYLLFFCYAYNQRVKIRKERNERLTKAVTMMKASRHTFSNLILAVKTQCDFVVELLAKICGQMSWSSVTWN